MLNNTGKLAGHTLFITGASRGIGKAIALKAARDGANVVIAAKTSVPHPKLPGTIYTAGKEIEAAGGRALPCIVDVRDEGSIAKAVENAVNMFGGIDIVVNNASAISLTGTKETPMKKFDLMHQINTRGTYLVTKSCIPHLMKSKHPHILNISPPLLMDPVWFKGHVAYTMAKFGMSMCVLGMAEEFRSDGIACNALWPKHAVSTSAMEMIGGPETLNQCRKPEIVADAAYAILTKDPKSFTGKFVIDEELLREEGITDLDHYSYQPGSELLPDFFVKGNEHFIAIRLSSQDSAAAPAAASDEAPSSSQSESGVGQLFTKMSTLMNEDLVSQTKATFAFEVKGDQPTFWFLDLKEGAGQCGPTGDAIKKADATFKMTEENFVQMFTGRLNPTSAFMQGKLKISGDMAKAMKLEKLLKQLKSKL